MTASRIVLPLVLVLLVSGCATSGVFNAAHLTNVELSEDNYRVVATGVAGEASASYLIGLSAATNSNLFSVGLIRVGGEPMLYKAAFDSLWTAFEAEHGAVEGRRLALTNVRFDVDALNFVIYTRPRISIRADVIEFE